MKKRTESIRLFFANVRGREWMKKRMEHNAAIRFFFAILYIEKASKPPSTTHTVPVTALEASDAR